MKPENNKGKIVRILKYVFLPLGILIDGLKVQGRSSGKKILVLIASLFILIVWLVWLSIILASFNTILYHTGIWKNYFDVPVSGTSMLPTINDGASVKLISVGGHSFERGDIVSFSNESTQGVNYLKRIIGMPGENIVIKNGLVFVNGKPLRESYVYQDVGTYGNTFLFECDLIEVPLDSYVVLGDNRTVSWDSRALGFVKGDEIGGYIVPDARPEIVENTPKKMVYNYDLDESKVLELINNKRNENNLNGLIPTSALSQMAVDRSIMIAGDLENWKSNLLPVDIALDDLEYRYNLAYEFVSFGYLDEEELFNQVMENPDAKAAILSDKFWEAGIGFTQVQNGECEYPLVSLILTWPSVPTYGTEMIEWWQRESIVTLEILSQLQSWVGVGLKDEVKLKEAILLVARMNEISSRIHKKMVNKEWFDQKDYTDINEYENMLNRFNILQDDLFPTVRGLQSQNTRPKLF